MQSISEFMGGERLSSLLGTPPLTANLAAVNTVVGAATSLSGSMTAGVLKTALLIEGRGATSWLALVSNDNTSRTARMRITLDGLVVRDFTSVALAGTNQGVVFVGIGAFSAGGNHTVVLQRLRFFSSLHIEIASSLTEVDKLTFAHLSETHQ